MIDNKRCDGQIWVEIIRHENTSYSWYYIYSWYYWVSQMKSLDSVILMTKIQIKNHTGNEIAMQFNSMQWE